MRQRSKELGQIWSFTRSAFFPAAAPRQPRAADADAASADATSTSGPILLLAATDAGFFRRSSSLAARGLLRKQRVTSRGRDGFSHSFLPERLLVEGENG